MPVVFNSFPVKQQPVQYKGGKTVSFRIWFGYPGYFIGTENYFMGMRKFILWE
jgi:hypothetical protein